MASGDPVVQVLAVMPPGSSFPALAVRAGGSTPAERVRVWRFADAASTYLDFLCRLTRYGGGGLTFEVLWSALTATTNAVRWGIALRRLQDDAEDVDTAQTYDYNYVADTTATVAGEQSTASITFTDGADMDSVANGEYFILRVTRDGANAADTMTDTAELWSVWGRET